ncbi:hypothetical protein BDP27DRAFT_1446664 [Rhodocollybia butyracea]|uniref:Uncharacterized protein n=1 Tax=Rhodocollybia butyracea TaxID=206335 RepID=A0A9P5PXL8_9AGAR|nr:hypothetical protein BDP27DRAFT_1446664 [Rhodocollybia butyracea]
MDFPSFSPGFQFRLVTSRSLLEYTRQKTLIPLCLCRFTGLLGASILHDVVWMIVNEQGGFIKVLTVLLLLLELSTFPSFALAIQGNEEHNWWVLAMPGGFTRSRDRYKNVDEVPAPPRAATPPPPLAPQAPAHAPGAYQTV